MPRKRSAKAPPPPGPGGKNDQNKPPARRRSTAVVSDAEDHRPSHAQGPARSMGLFQSKVEGQNQAPTSTPTSAPAQGQRAPTRKKKKASQPQNANAAGSAPSGPSTDLPRKPKAPRREVKPRKAKAASSTASPKVAATGAALSKGQRQRARKAAAIEALHGPGTARRAEQRVKKKKQAHSGAAGGPGPSTAQSRARSQGKARGTGQIWLTGEVPVDLADEEELMNGHAAGSSEPASASSPAPTAFRPMARSILTGVDQADVIIDERPAPGVPRTHGRGGGNAFQPPAMFTTSLLPESVPASDLPGGGYGDAKADGESALVLPDHVQLNGADDSDDEYNAGGDVSMVGLHFLDSDVAKGVSRYFDPDLEDPDSDAAFLATADQSKVCQRCKRPGHPSSKCPHVVCAACGAIDEHDRRDCPHMIICFNCEKSGHASKDCPEPRNRSAVNHCELCRSREHRKRTCPSLWRQYDYNTPDEQVTRQSARRVATGWVAQAIGGQLNVDKCYNCAGSGHLGDDCPRRRGSLARLLCPSAFSLEMLQSGPFGRFQHTRAPGSQRPTHQRFDDGSHDDPANLPGQKRFPGFDAGRKGKDKARAVHKQHDRYLGQSEDEEDVAPVFRGQGHASTSTPRNQAGGGGAARRPWDSDLRDGRGKAGESEVLPFGHAHLMSPGAPASAPARGRGIAFGQFGSGPGGDESGMDTPTGPSRARGGLAGAGRGGRGGASRLLVERALGASSAPGSRFASPGAVPGRAHSERGDESDVSEGGTMRKRARKDRSGGESGSLDSVQRAQEEYEREWRASGAGLGAAGGSVVGWGKEDDAFEREERRRAERSGGTYKGDGGAGAGIKAAALRFVQEKQRQGGGGARGGGPGRGGRQQRGDDRARMGPATPTSAPAPAGASGFGIKGRARGGGQMYTGGY